MLWQTTPFANSAAAATNTWAGQWIAQGDVAVEKAHIVAAGLAVVGLSRSSRALDWAPGQRAKRRTGTGTGRTGGRTTTCVCGPGQEC